MLHHLITSYGYSAILILTFFEGEVILVLGGIAAQHGYLDLNLVIAAAFVGTFLGDQLYFHLGYRVGPALFERKPSWRAAVERLYGLLNRHENLFVLSFRFCYGLRTVASFVFGASRMSKARFLVLNAAGALLWAVVIAYGGFLFGTLFEHFFEGFERYSLDILMALLGLAGIFLGIRAWRRRR
ncbi:MAG: DedA family protein [Acidiferrobacteraceae bacterium]|jgi:membrane protein DedA with SNARE-associated domain